MTTLISPEHLHAVVSDPNVVIVDVQWNLAGPSGLDLYRLGHIPGAHHISLDSDLAGPPGQGGRHPLPDPLRLQSVLRGCGVNESSRVVVYDQCTSLAAARAWWVLSWCGLKATRVLDGGLQAWQDAGFDTSTSITQPATPGDVTLHPGSVLYLTADEAGSWAQQGRLFDARARERFNGESEPIDPIAGHIPGAHNCPMSDYQSASGRFEDPNRLRAYFAEHGIAPGDTVGTTCGSGVTACHLALALAQVGVNARPYIGSWSDWVSQPERPVAVGPAQKGPQ